MRSYNFGARAMVGGVKRSVSFVVLLVCLLSVIAIFSNTNFRSEDNRSRRVTVNIRNQSEQLTETQPRNCSFHKCFNITLCPLDRQDRIGVYVYERFSFTDEEGNALNVPFSLEYEQLVDAVKSSDYYQPNVLKACLFIPPIDTLSQARINTTHISSSLASLPHWNNGVNHILVNMLPGSPPDYNTTMDIAYGAALIAGGGFSVASFKYGFDVSIPVFNSITRQAHVMLTGGPMREHLLTIFRSPNHLPEIIEALEKLSNEEDALSLHSCSDGRLAQGQSHLLNQCFGSKVVSYPAILQRSRYCLIVHQLRYGTHQLIDAMMSGCIPVLLSDGYILPFAEVLDWSRASIRINPNDINRLFSILGRISVEHENEMRKQVVFLWERYFSSMGSIVTTVLDVINDRVFPHLARQYESWNNDPNADPSVLLQYRYPSTTLPSPDVTRGFTAVILTYDRVTMLREVIRGVARASNLAMILIIWNNLDKSPPSIEELPAINKPIKIIRSKENKLSNRFYPYPEITTDCVLSIDDDIVMLTPDELEFGYTVWTEYPEHLVGFPGRVHFWDDVEGMWKYNSEWTNNISIMLTGAAFYHKFYHHLYTYHLPESIKDWVDEKMNCEDIAMNFVIANYTGNAPVKVTPRKKFKCPDCSPVGSLWSDPDHFKERHECLKLFAGIYGNMPLRSVQFRADPVLYKDEQSSQEPLKFPDMGSL